MKVLILSCNTGEGHNSAAKALQEVFLLQGDECVIKDALSFGTPRVSRFICKYYLDMVKLTPHAFSRMYFHNKNITKTHESKIKSSGYWLNSFCSKHLNEFLQANPFDVIICTHIFAACTLTHLKRHEKLHIPFYFISTDYSCSPLMKQVDVNKILYAHPKIKEDFTIRDVPEDLLVPTGIPVSQKFVTKIPKEEARAQLGLSVTDKLIFMMSGSMGHGDLFDLAAKVIKDSPENTKLLVVTGNNKKVYNEFKRRFKNNSKLIVIGYTDKIALYLDACDVFMTKPGGLSSTEALVKEVPIVHMTPIPGCETENAEFFSKNKLSLYAKNINEAAALAIDLLNNEALLNEIKSAQKENKFANSAKTIVDYVKEQNSGSSN